MCYFDVSLLQTRMYNLSGGLQSTLAGGNFKSDFLSGGISSTLGSLTAGWGDAGQLFTGIAGGGIGSVIGGGSFIDGAQMGAITVGLNHLGHKFSLRRTDPKLPPTFEYKNGEIISASDGHDYILHDNKWLQIETEKQYNTRVAKRKKSGRTRKGPEAPRGTWERFRYNQVVVQSGGFKNAVGFGSVLGGAETIFKGLKGFTAPGIIGGYIKGQFSAYSKMYNRMKLHDRHVDYYRKKN